jgi:hypothetical protein
VNSLQLGVVKMIQLWDAKIIELVFRIIILK